jgi:peptide/nickel transport system substrate-binding protein
MSDRLGSQRVAGAPRLRGLIAAVILPMLVALAPSRATPQALPAVPRNRTLILENIDGRVPVPGNMNPYVAGQFLEWGMWQATQESLFYYNLETGRLDPWLARSSRYSDGGRTVTIELQPGVRWSDGVPFTADDVAFTIEMLKKNLGLQYSFDMDSWVESANAPNPTRVVIHLKRPNPHFVLTYFAVPIWRSILIAPKHIWEHVDPKTFNNYDPQRGLPLGTGPYRLVRSSETETVFDRRDRWWAADAGLHPMPSPQRLIWISAGTEDTRAAMAVNNQLDAMWVMSRSTFEIARRRNAQLIGWTKALPYGYLDPCPRNLYFNTAAAPFDRTAVRRAINQAINRAQLVTVAYEGMSEPSYSVFPTYAPLKPFLERNAALLQALHSQPPQVATLMQSAGFRRGPQGLWVGADGRTVRFTIDARSGEADLLKMGPVLVYQLRAAGFDAAFRPTETAIFSSDVAMGRSTVYLSDSCGSVQDPYASLALFHSKQSAPIGQLASGVVPTRFANAEFDAAIDAMAKLPAEEPAFASAADTALRIFSRELPAIPLVQARLLTPFNQTYWSNWPSAENDYIQPGHWWITGDQLLINVRPTGR